MNCLGYAQEKNPVACMRYIDKRGNGRKSCPGHFRSESTPLVTFFCVGEKVAKG